MTTPKRPGALEEAEAPTVPDAATRADSARAVVSRRPAESFTVGSTLAGRFRIEDHLGTGGMGVVFVARDLKHDLRVALKTLRRLGAGQLALFKNEFRALDDLHHPSLVLSLPGASEAERRRANRAEEATRSEHIRNPARMFAVLAPGVP